MEQNRLLRNRGACVDTVFRHVSRKVIFMKGRWPIWKESKDVHGWNRPMEFADGLREYALKMLICPLWCSDQGRVADEVEGGEEDPDSTRILTIRL